MDILSAAHKKLLIELLDAGVEYILIGGYAVNYHGYPRYTNDMDIWLKPDNENKKKLADYFESKKFSTEGVSRIRELDFTQTLAFHIGADENRVDFLTHISGVAYAEANEKKVFLPLSDKKVPVIQYHHLILSKISSDRPQDKADVEQLQQIERLRKKKE